MVRTQIQLTEEQSVALKRAAHDRSVSMAEVIRQAIDQFLAQDDWTLRRQRMLAAVQKGGFRSGLRDISVNHDKYLAEGKRW